MIPPNENKREAKPEEKKERRFQDGVVRLYNRSEKTVNKLIDGVRVVIPGRGSADVSAKRAEIMLDEFPDALTEDPNYAKRVFSKEEYEMVEELDEGHLRACLKVLMGNGIPDIKGAFEDQISHKDDK